MRFCIMGNNVPKCIYCGEISNLIIGVKCTDCGAEQYDYEVVREKFSIRAPHCSNCASIFLKERGSYCGKCDKTVHRCTRCFLEHEHVINS